jgi:hypothetical protein
LLHFTDNSNMGMKFLESDLCISCHVKYKVIVGFCQAHIKAKVARNRV